MARAKATEARAGESPDPRSWGFIRRPMGGVLGSDYSLLRMERLYSVPDSMVASLDAELVQRPKVNQHQSVSLTRSSFPNCSHCLEKQDTHSEAIDDICQTYNRWSF